MTENYNINDADIKLIICRACLRTGTGVYPMSNEEKHLYRMFVVEASNEILNCICIYCGWLLKKYVKFLQQCKKANDIINKAYEKDPKSAQFLSRSISTHSISITILKTHYLGPENILDIDLDANIQDWNEIFVNDNDTIITSDNDDEIPLALLSKDCVDSQNITRKRRIKSQGDESVYDENLIDMKIKTELDIKQESETNLQESCTNKRSKKRKKTVRDGFSSRMVQETDEYLVIKLSKEQVLQEMQDKLKCDKYQRSIYKCEKCVKGFNFEDVLQSHMKRHSMEYGTLKCDICFQYCPNAVSLRGHMKSHTTRYKCKVCDAVRLSRQHLLEHHANSHTDHAASYSCNHCQFTTNKRTVMQRHVRSHAPRQRHTCEKCGKLFYNIESLRVHAVRHDSSKRICCSHCGIKFIYPSLLQKHVQAVHVQKDYYCVECDVSFQTPYNLNLHFKRAKKHRDSSSYKHQCPDCEKRFLSLSSLQAHLTSTHGQPKRHACSVCRRQYSSAETLRSHVRRSHSAVELPRPSCHVCNRSFSQNSVLKKHMRTHTGERPYVCACGASFAQRATLRAHRHAKHDKEQEVSPVLPVENTPNTARDDCNNCTAFVVAK